MRGDDEGREEGTSAGRGIQRHTVTCADGGGGVGGGGDGDGDGRALRVWGEVVRGGSDV